MLIILIFSLFVTKMRLELVDKSVFAGYNIPKIKER